MDKILSIFDGSFLYNDGKEIRINTQEDGQLIQIKLTFTAAKTPVEQGEDIAIPGAISKKVETSNELTNSWEEVKPIEPTAEEKNNVNDLLRSLGL